MINLNNSRDRPALALVMDNGRVGPGPNEFGRVENALEGILAEYFGIRNKIR
jgi:hypothetical protein